jgi:hypothetical protein
LGGILAKWYQGRPEAHAKLDSVWRHVGASKTERQAHHLDRVLTFYDNALGEETVAILKALVILNGVVDESKLRSHLPDPLLAIDKIQAALGRMEDLGLLRLVDGLNRVEIHPLVSRYFFIAHVEDQRDESPDEPGAPLYPAAPALPPDTFRPRVRGAVRTRGGTRLN